MYDIVQAGCDEVETSQECSTENIFILVRFTTGGSAFTNNT